MNVLPADDAQRELLHNEIHARPPIALWPNERIINQAFILDAISRRQQLSWINRASSSFPLHHGTAHNPSIRVLEIAPEPQRILLKWEMHGEFVSVTIFSQQPRAMSYFGLNLLLSLAIPIIFAALAQMLRAEVNARPNVRANRGARQGDSG